MKKFKNYKDLWDGSTKKVLETVPDDLKWIQKTLIEQWKKQSSKWCAHVQHGMHFYTQGEPEETCTDKLKEFKNWN